MTELEKRAVRALLGVKVPDKTWHGARIESLNLWMTVQSERPLRGSDLSDLWFLVWRYRRQIEDNVVIAKSDELVNGAMNLEFS